MSKNGATRPFQEFEFDDGGRILDSLGSGICPERSKNLLFHLRKIWPATARGVNRNAEDLHLIYEVPLVQAPRRTPEKGARRKETQDFSRLGFYLKTPPVDDDLFEILKAFDTRNG